MSKRLNKTDRATLAYFARGAARDPDSFWLADTNRRSPPMRVVRLANAGLLERCKKSGNSDLFRITPAGRAAFAAS